MSNMSYCRFQNTSGDLRDCKEALSALCSGSGDPLSAAELNAARSLLNTCVEILIDFAQDAEVEFDLEAVDRAIVQLSSGTDFLSRLNDEADERQRQERADERLESYARG